MFIIFYNINKFYYLIIILSIIVSYVKMSVLIAICFKQLGWNFLENKIDIEFYRLHRNFQKSERE